MFLQEMKKQWKRPEIIIAFIVVCVVQLITVAWFSPHDNKQEYNQAYEKYSGVMNAEWKASIVKARTDYITKPEYLRSDEELKTVLEMYGFTENSTAAEDPFFVLKEEYYTTDFLVLDHAYAYTEFDSMLEQHILQKQQELISRDAGHDVSRVETAYKRLLETSDELIFDNGRILNDSITYGFPIMQRCVLLFGILFCAGFFTTELHRNTYELLEVSKYGKTRLYWCKFAVNQYSTFLVTLALIGIMGLGITVSVGWQGVDCFVQDFVFNHCPFVWNVGMFLFVMSIMALAVGQVIAAVIFVMSRIIGSILAIVCSAFVVLLVPVFAASNFPSLLVLRLWPSTLMYSYHLWADYSEQRIGDLYLADWKIAIIEIVVVFGVMMFLSVRYQSKTLDVFPKKENVTVSVNYFKEKCGKKYENISERNMEI